MKSTDTRHQDAKSPRRTSFFVALLIIIASVGWQPASADEKQSGAEGPEKILVIGASGRTGRLIVTELMARHHEVRGLTRDAERAREINPSVEWVQGDLRKPDTLATIVTGVDRIVFAAGSGSHTDPTNLPKLVEFEGLAVLVDLGVETKVKHFTMVSSGGVSHADPEASDGFPGVMRWKGEAESYLRNSGLPYTIVRPSSLGDAPARDTGIALAQGDAVFANAIKTSRADVARVVVETLYNPDAGGKTFEMYNAPTRDIDDWKPALARLNPDVEVH